MTGEERCLPATPTVSQSKPPVNCLQVAAECLAPQLAVLNSMSIWTNCQFPNGNMSGSLSAACAGLSPNVHQIISEFHYKPQSSQSSLCENLPSQIFKSKSSKDVFFHCLKIRWFHLYLIFMVIYLFLFYFGLSILHVICSHSNKQTEARHLLFFCLFQLLKAPLLSNQGLSEVFL